MDDSLPELGDLEREVMQLVWADGPVTAEAIREQLSRPCKESTVGTVLLGGVVGIGLNLFRVRNPHLHMTAWAMVLAASLSMPLLMHWTTVTVTVDALPLPAAERLWPAGGSWGNPSPEPLHEMLATGQAVPATIGSAHGAGEMPP